MLISITHPSALKLHLKSVSRISLTTSYDRHSQRACTQDTFEAIIAFKKTTLDLIETDSHPK